MSRPLGRDALQPKRYRQVSGTASQLQNAAAHDRPLRVPRNVAHAGAADLDGQAELLVVRRGLLVEVGRVLPIDG